jgi:hypothetical protein
MSTLRPVTTRIMSPSEWHAVQDNPIQRDTQERAAHAKHLRVPSPAHAVVHAAELPDGTLVKLDGHTRSYLWSQGGAPTPRFVTVLLYPVGSIAEATDLYRHFDAPEAAENARDRLAGGERAAGFHPVSSLLRARYYAESLRLAQQMPQGSTQSRFERLPADELVKLWKAELLLLDEAQIAKARLMTGHVTAALLGFRRHKDIEARRMLQKFWSIVAARGGNQRTVEREDETEQKNTKPKTRTLTERDSAASLVQTTWGERSELMRPWQLAEKSVSALEGWLAGRYFVMGLKGTNLRGYVKVTRP